MTKKIHCDHCDKVPAVTIELCVGFSVDPADARRRVSTEFVDLCLDCVSHLTFDLSELMTTDQPMSQVKGLLLKFKKLKS